VLALTPDASASTRVPCLAYINIPLSVSKFSAASRGLPAIARLSFITS